MAGSLRLDWGWSIAASAAPVIVGAALLLAGVSKLHDSSAFMSFLQAFPFIPQRFKSLTLRVLPSAEVVIGFWLTLGKPWMIVPLLSAFVLLVSFEIISIVAAAMRLRVDCGCYGTLARTSPAVSAFRTALLIGLTALALLGSRVDAEIMLTGMPTAIVTLGLVMAAILAVEIKRRQLTYGHP